MGEALQADSVAAEYERVAERPKQIRPRARVSGVFASLTVANALGAATGFISGPLLARALGASGRGDLAAIVVPLALAPPVLGLGVGTFAFRQLPRGRPIGEIVGSLGLPLVVIGLLAAAAAVPLADALAGGRETVRTFLIIGFVLMPVTLVEGLLLACLAALEYWRRVVVATATPFLVPFAAIVVLYVLDDLTVGTAAAATLIGSLLPIVLCLPLLTAGRPIFRLRLARSGISFGLKAWIGGLALLANLRLDQFIMITVVAPRVLGLYAVATTISGASGLATGALQPPLMTRIAGGERHLLPQAVRVTLAASVVMGVVLALLTPAILSVLFGPEFDGAIPMALVLLAASIPLAGAQVLSAGLQADGAPLIPSTGEGLALVITVVGLLLLLGPLGGIGAAMVSLAAYSTSFLFQLTMTRRRTGWPLRQLLVPTRADARWARSTLGALVVRLRVWG
jgi:O-antigen/teichoic acid export membrane protein